MCSSTQAGRVIHPGTCSRDKNRGRVNVGGDIFVLVFAGCSISIKVEEEMYKGGGGFSETVFLSRETIGIINVSEEFNWCSFMC